MTGYVEREGGFEAGLVLFKRHVNTTPVQFAHRQKTFFSPAIEYAIPSPSPFSLSPFSLSSSRFHGCRPSLTYSSAPRFIYNVLRSAMTRRSLRFAQRGNNKDRGHVYHTLLDTGLLLSRHGPPWEQLPPFKDARFRSRIWKLGYTRCLEKKGGKESGRKRCTIVPGYCFPGNRVCKFFSKRNIYNSANSSRLILSLFYFLRAWKF